MAAPITDAQIPELIRLVEASMEEAEASFGDLDSAQINWKPSANEWSVGQCLDHLVVAVRSYTPQIEAIIAGSYTPTIWARLPLLPRVFGPLLIKALSPGTAYPMSAPPVFRPRESTIEPTIVDTFVATQQQTIRFMQASKGLHPERIIITSPALSFVTYSLLDTFRIFAVHNQLHIAQARRVLASARAAPSAG